MEARPVEEVDVLAVAQPSIRVGPDLEVLEPDLSAVLHLLERSRFSPARHHPAGIVLPAVVSLIREPPQVRVALPVARAHRELESLLLPPLPELLFEDLALVRFGELQEERLLGREDDRRHELRQPLAVVVGKSRDPVFPRRLRSGPARTGPGK
jgi:hypothetical protein